MNSLVETRLGRLQGLLESNVYSWRGIPYAQPPVGKLRFRAPQPIQSWSDVRDATQFGPIAPQAPSGLQSRLKPNGQAPPEPVMSEDCLYLNVWAPNTTTEKRPVMVWIHGGAFVTGGGSLPIYDGARFAARGDVIVVTLNYRLGPLGFLHLADLAPDCDNNVGLLDQLAALRWVQDNISAFGGDPARVTVFGESAGAMSIADWFGMPASKGLFQAAILQSGAVRVQQPQQAHLLVQAFLTEVGVSQAAQLRELPVQTLIQAGQRVLSAWSGGLPFQPVLDGKTISVHPLQALANGVAANIPMLIGTNHDEGNLFIPPQATGKKLEKLLEPIVGPDRAMPIARSYPSSRAGHAQLFTDTVFWLPALQLAERQLVQAPVWMYRFDWCAPTGQPVPGAYHALELVFVWDMLNSPTAQLFVGPNPAPYPLATAMHQSWLAFAQQQNPNVSELPVWEPYTLHDRATMIFDTECWVENDPQREKRQVWANTALA